MDFFSRTNYAVAWQRNSAKTTALLEIYNIKNINKNENSYNKRPHTYKNRE